MVRFLNNYAIVSNSPGANFRPPPRHAKHQPEPNLGLLTYSMYCKGTKLFLFTEIVGGREVHTRPAVSLGRGGHREQGAQRLHRPEEVPHTDPHAGPQGCHT